MTPLLALLLVLDLEALAALLWAFFTPSESGQGVFLWLSPQRLVLVALLLVICVGLLAVSIQLRRSKGSTERLTRTLDAWCLDQGQLAASLLALSILPLLAAAAALAVLLTPLQYEAYKTWAPGTFPLLRSIVSALLPLLAFKVIACLQIAVVLALRYRRVLFTSAVWARDRIALALLVLLAVVATAFHWLLLVFQLRFFVNIPAWYWIFARLPFTAGDVGFGLGALLLLGLAYWVLIVKHRVAAGLALVAALGWFLQVGIGLMGGGGMATLRDRYFTTYHQAYIARASENDLTIIESIRQYEAVYGSSSFTSTKPPGLMAFYVGLEQLVNGFPSPYDNALRYERLSNVVTCLFPVLAMSMVVMLYAFARRWLDEPAGIVRRAGPLLYVITPGVALFTFFADQAIYPLVFLLGVWFAVIATRRQSLAWAFLLGAVLYAAVFFAFTMLPLYPFAGLYLLLHYWHERSGEGLSRALWAALAIAAGTLLLHFLSAALLNYNFLPRFEQTMTINHNFDFYLRLGQQPPGAPESLGVRLGQIHNAAWINNLDFAAAIGFPVYILFLIQAVRRVGRFIKGSAASGDIILLALLTSFLVLNLAGTAQGEVPRLWLFWLPMVVLLAAHELEPHLQKRPALLLGVGVAQVITIMLTFHFQDLRM
jgi:hypothetical protein